MSKALFSSFRTALILTLFFILDCFLVFLSQALRHCRSPETNIHLSILFSPSPPPLTPLHFKGTFAIFPQGFFIMTPAPVYDNFEKYPPPCLFHPVLQLITEE